jgi:nitrate reductase gamma subunit
VNTFRFGIYPYIAACIFLFGSLMRFDREQYSWKADSTQMIDRGNLRLGSVLFHIGVLGLFFGHLAGLLTPVAVWDWLGVPHRVKQATAMIAGGALGTLCLIGLVILLHRRLSSARLSALTKTGDRVLLLWLLVTLLLGLSTIRESAAHMDGALMVSLMTWAQHIVTFQGDAASHVAHAPWLFRLHLFMGMSLFVIFPFTRLVHVWSGFASITYLSRAWQLVRSR